MARRFFVSCFRRVYDAAVVGAGYAGVAAAMGLRQAGKSVLLTDLGGDVLWESSRAFGTDTGQCDSPHWRKLTGQVARRTGREGGLLDGAIAEVAATRMLIADDGLDVLYYAAPVAVEQGSGGIEAAVMATKSGLARVAARQWVDATERGGLARLCRPGLQPPAPDRQVWALFLQQAHWPEVDLAALREAGLDLLATGWQTERALTFTVDGGQPHPRLQILPAIARAHEALGEALADAQISHGSFVPLGQYAPAEPAGQAADNLAIASAALAPTAVRSLADRFALGLAAAEALADAGTSRPTEQVLDRDLPALAPLAEARADVAVAGAGTGGALAAIAAGRGFEGRSGHVLCFDLLPAAGGIGTIGGIHVYYYGLPGGLQKEMDDRVTELVAGCGGLLDAARGFHPTAKSIVLEQMIVEAGVDLRFGWMLCDVQRSGGAVGSAWVATEDGPVRVTARAWIDGTGDGDLCVRAGASWQMGRQGDSLPHAYSQSSGRLTEADGKVRIGGVNFDAGFCDPTDVEDLTRARLRGIGQYDREAFDNTTRPTYIAPALGLRQSRQIDTDVQLTLDDLIRRRRFDDAIGYTGCHYDNHAVDYQLESDEGAFWTWVAGSHRVPIACDISYRMLLPRGIDNVWIASRCLGVSQDAHHTLRMQRDMQRIGEVAGRAAAMAVQQETDSRGLAGGQLRAALETSGAMDLPAEGSRHGFGAFVGPEMLDERSEQDRTGEAMESLDAGTAGPLLWHLVAGGPEARQFVTERLDSEDANVSWLAAGVAAMWADPAAEGRLVRAVEDREWGFEDQAASAEPGREPRDPFTDRRLAPRWLAALVLLRRCGTERCRPVLDDLSRSPHLSMDARVAVALALEALARRGAAGEPAGIEAILDRLPEGDIPGRVAAPQRPVGAIAELSARADRDEADPPDAADLADDPTAEDYTWQLDLAVAKARLAAGLDLPDRLAAYLRDPRGHVRRAFGELLG